MAEISISELTDIQAFRALFLFRSPRHGQVQPQQVPAGCEWIELIISGHAFPATDCAQSELAGPGDLFWSLPGEWTLHRYPPHAPYVCLALIFDTAVGLERPAPRRSHWSDLHAALSFVEETQHALHTGTWRSPAFMRYVYHRLQWVAFQHHRTADLQFPPSLVKALSLIVRQLENDLTLPVLAKTAGCSVSCLCDLFRRHLATSPHDYITNKRLIRAKSLLTNSGMLTKEVATACGFNSVSQFCRTFRRLVGKTPQEYRGNRITD